jgi:hypothetical protein
MTIVRRIAAVIVGLGVAMLIVTAAEQLAHRMYPPPAGASLPLTPMLLVLAGWLIATFLGALIAAKIARHRLPADIVGALLLCAGFAKAVTIPQPMWFSVASFVIIGAAQTAARVAYSTAPAS